MKTVWKYDDDTFLDSILSYPNILSAIFFSSLMPCRHYKSFFPKNSKKKGNKFKIEVIFFKKNFHTRFSTNKIQSNKLYFNLGNKIKTIK